MATEEFKIHTCDRCAAHRRQPINRDFPVDWTKVARRRVQGGAIEWFDLCPDCSSNFDVWLVSAPQVSS